MFIKVFYAESRYVKLIFLNMFFVFVLLNLTKFLTQTCKNCDMF